MFQNGALSLQASLPKQSAVDSFHRSFDGEKETKEKRRATAMIKMHKFAEKSRENRENEYKQTQYTY